MAKLIEVPDVVQDGGIGEYDHPLIIRVYDDADGALTIYDGDGRVYLYPEQVRALYEGLKAHYEEEHGKGIQTVRASP